MAGMIKGVLFGLLLSALFSIGAEAQTINAASCNASDVRTALNSVAQDGTTVVIPSCPSGVTWSSNVTYNQTYSTTVQGQTVCTGSGDPAYNNLTCTDNTVLNWTGSGQMLTVNTASGKSFRITGLSFNFSGMSAYGALSFEGNSTAFRFDHSHIYNVPSGYTPVATDGPARSHGSPSDLRRGQYILLVFPRQQLAGSRYSGR